MVAWLRLFDKLTTGSDTMDSPGAVGRRRGNSRINAEDQALDQIAKEVSGSIFFIAFRRHCSLHLVVLKADGG